MKGLVFPLLAGLLVFVAVEGAPRQTGIQTENRRTVAETSGRIRVPGLQKAVTVVRDRWGVAHIYAENSHDLFFAQGFVAAQDHLFQMELLKRAGQGRLAEVLGAEMLQRDITARLLRYQGSLDAEYGSYAADTREILTAFTDGINASIANRQPPGGRGWGKEFQAAGFAPEPWKPEDCLSRASAFPALGREIRRKISNGRLVARVRKDAAARLLAFEPAMEIDALPQMEFNDIPVEFLGSFPDGDGERTSDPAAGSDAWAVSGRLTKNRLPILASSRDETDSSSASGFVHLSAPGWDVIGIAETALPGVSAGHNARVAWGFSDYPVDSTNIYVEELHPHRELSYKVRPGWRDLETEMQVFRVRGGRPVNVVLKFSVNGPALANWIGEDGRRVLTLKWTGREPGTAPYLAALSLDRAQTWQQRDAALARWKAPAVTVAYADMEGRIGARSAALAPIRVKCSGLFASLGDHGCEWEGFVPPPSLPGGDKTASDYVLADDQKLALPAYRFPIGFRWEPALTARRVEDILKEGIAKGRILTVEDAARIQADPLPPSARELQRLLRHAAGVEDEAARRLLAWNGGQGSDPTASELFAAWWKRLGAAVLRVAAPGTPADLFPGGVPAALLLKYVSHPDPDIFGPQPEAARDHLLRQSLRQAWHEWKTHPRSAPAGPPAQAPPERRIRMVLDPGDWDGSLANVSSSAGGYSPLVYSRAAVERGSVERLVLEP